MFVVYSCIQCSLHDRSGVMNTFNDNAVALTWKRIPFLVRQMGISDLASGTDSRITSSTSTCEAMRAALINDAWPYQRYESRFTKSSRTPNLPLGPARPSSSQHRNMGRGGTWLVRRVLSRRSGRGRISIDQLLAEIWRKNWAYGTLYTSLDDDKVGSCDYRSANKESDEKDNSLLSWRTIASARAAASPFKPAIDWSYSFLIVLGKMFPVPVIHP